MIVKAIKPLKTSNLKIDSNVNFLGYNLTGIGLVQAEKMSPRYDIDGYYEDLLGYTNGVSSVVARILNDVTKATFDLFSGRLMGNLNCNGYYLDDFAVDAGDTVVANAIVEHVTSYPSYLIKAAIKMRRKMRVNVEVEVYVNTLGQSAYVALFKDGVIIAGTEQTCGEISYTKLYWSNIEIADGSELQCAIHSSDGVALVYQRNFCVKVLDYADCYVSVQ